MEQSSDDLVRFVLIVRPIFIDERGDFGPDYPLIPCVVGFLAARETEKTVPNAKALSQIGFVRCNLPVQFRHFGHDSIDQPIRNPARDEEGSKARRLELRG